MADLQIFAKSQKNHNLVFYGDQILATGFKMHILPLHHRTTCPFDVYITLNKSFTITVQIWLSHRVVLTIIVKYKGLKRWLKMPI